MSRAAAVDVGVRVATANDSGAVAALVGARGLPLAGLDDLWRIWVAVVDGEVVGTASLERHGDALLLRSVAVTADLAGLGVGAQLVEAALAEADNVGPVALLTETAAEWFPRFGFRATTRDLLPSALAMSPELQYACPASAVAMIREIPRPPTVPTRP